MTTIKITVDTRAIEQFASKLVELGSGKARRALADALNKVGNKLRTQEKKTLVEQTGVAYGKIGMRTHPASVGFLQYELIQPGSESNISDFRGRQLAAGVNARPWNKSRLFAHTWMVKKFGMRTFHRVSKERLPIRPVFAANLAREILKDQAREVFERAPSQLAPAIEAQIRRFAP